MPCRAYTNCDEVEFVVNGSTVAKATVSGSLAIAPEDLTYEPGTLVVRGYIRGQLMAEHQQVTAGGPARLAVAADRTTFAASGQDVALLRVAVTDAKGNLVPDANHNISVEAVGQGRIVGVHNADPSTDNYSARSSSRAFNGFLGVYVVASGGPGHIIFTATADGLEQATIKLEVSDQEPRHQVHTAADEAASPLFGLHVHYG
ncbi:glycoside hydrolase family 2 [Fusarium albosuccineum]|uniref:Glycoside hydrolase family 2 n=1 Tax=Fusarium albosuccineum TaxID=1237068 RepID=A0A8H4JP76_9HYPO|nr:glycoside hydrolase family 2 [Fusarium albosuccineum]